MTQKTRAIIFWTMGFIFFIITPLILFYALGYSYDWQNKKIVQTGAFYIKTTPKNANIYINDKYKNRSPRLIKRLIPRSYNIKITKKNFHPWEKNLIIESGLVTEVIQILLIPKEIQLNTVAQEIKSLSDFFLNQQEKEKQKIALKTLENISSSIISYQIFKDNIFYLLKPNYILYKTNLDGSNKEQLSLMPLGDKSETYDIFISPHRKIVLLSGQGNLYLLNENKNFDLMASEVISASFADDNQKLAWQTNNEIWIYWLTNYLAPPYRKTGDKEFITRFSQKIKQIIWHPNNQHLLFIINETIKIIELDGRDQRNIVDILTIKDPQILFKNSELYILSEDNLYKTNFKK